MLHQLTLALSVLALVENINAIPVQQRLTEQHSIICGSWSPKLDQTSNSVLSSLLSPLISRLALPACASTEEVHIDLRRDGDLRELVEADIFAG